MIRPRRMAKAELVQPPKAVIYSAQLISVPYSHEYTQITQSIESSYRNHPPLQH